MTSEQIARRDSGDTTVLWEVVMEYDTLIRKCVHRWNVSTNYQLADDLLQHGRETCYKAAQKFVPNGQPDYWKNYLANYIKGACNRYIKKYGDLAMEPDDISDVEYYNSPSSPRVEAQALLCEINTWCKENLSELHFGIFYDSFINPDYSSPHDLAIKHGIAERSVRRIIKNIRAKLREAGYGSETDT